MAGSGSPCGCYLNSVNTFTDHRAIERRLLDLAYTTDAKITATSLAYYAPCSIEDASRVLDDLAAHDRLDMEIQDDGSVVYHLRGRERLPPSPSATRALAPIVERQPASFHPNPLFAAVFSLLVPGAGHLYAGRYFAAIVWFFAVSVAYLLVVPGLILHLFSVGSAANAAIARGREGPIRPRLLAA
jgi:hypothetical protein